MVLIFANDVTAFNEQVEHFIKKHVNGVLQEAKLLTSYNLDTAIGEATLKHYNDLILKNDLGEFDLVPYQEKQLIRKSSEYFNENPKLYTIGNSKTKTITTMSEKNENEKNYDVELLSGYIGKDGVKSEIVEKNNTLVANFSIGSGPRDQTVWTQVEAWGPVAEKIKDLPKGAKVTISGNIRDASYVNKDGKDVKKEVLTAKEISLHQLQELKGTVDSIKHTEKYIDIKLYVNNGGEKADLHNLRVFGDERAKFENVKEKDVLSLTGDVQFREYTKDNEVKTALNTICKTLHSVTPHAEKGAAVEEKKETKVEAAAEAKAPKKAGKKDKGVSM